ncbi:MAG: hypothetical protein K9K66_15805 [Desulfarculaceae bacterium]|nr:hypothetical protein [Desulfarculaceae bacterium]MCF8073649.1 hypothetical protein [Desulfarculaceae bacterium]MCF8103119.1 hypothetical protein [Desulfarculaceae bacterium]MCF8115635.1 hypothetical protein [Desulfarculaceae bacterium]
MKQKLRKMFFKMEAADPDKWQYVLQICAAGIGELYYGQALCRHAGLDARYFEACERGLGTFKNIQMLTEEKTTNLKHKEASTINSRHIFYALSATIIASIIARPDLVEDASLVMWFAIGSILTSGLLVFCYKFWRKWFLASYYS